MSAHRFFLTAALPPGEGAVELPLTAEDRHHAASVLRLRAGEEIEAVEPERAAGWRVRLTEVSSAAILGERVERLELVRHPDITLVQGVAKGDKMDAIVRQAVEVGATAIIPVLTQRSVVRLEGTKRMERGERWRRIAKAAAEQSHRESVPAVHDPMTLREALPVLGEFDGVIVMWEDERGTGLEAALSSWVTPPTARIALVVGPEGGLAAEEVKELESLGSVTVSLGPLILRTETAAVVALALAAYGLGGLGRG